MDRLALSVHDLGQAGCSSEAREMVLFTNPYTMSPQQEHAILPDILFFPKVCPAGHQLYLSHSSITTGHRKGTYTVLGLLKYTVVLTDRRSSKSRKPGTNSWATCCPCDLGFLFHLWGCSSTSWERQQLPAPIHPIHVPALIHVP